jgi:hypothetical protein
MRFLGFSLSTLANVVGPYIHAVDFWARFTLVGLYGEVFTYRVGGTLVLVLGPEIVGHDCDCITTKYVVGPSINVFPTRIVVSTTVRWTYSNTVYF